MPVNAAKLIEMFEHVLTLSNVDATQSVAVLSSDYSDERLVSAAMIAAQRLNAKTYGINLPAYNNDDAMGSDLTAYLGETSLTGHIAAQKALEAADLIVDTMMLLHSPEQEAILKKGGRILLAVEPPEILARLLPNEGDKERVLAAAEVLEKARKFTVTSKAGTEFEADIGNYPILKEYGFAETPGRWDHWGSGFLATWPDEDSSQGKIVIDVGDIIFPFKSYARDPVVLEIKDGFICNIDGGLDAELLRDYMNSFADPEVFALSHLGWGLQPRAQWSALAVYDKTESIGMDGRAFAGNFLFSTGPNSEVGGSRVVPCHMDIPMRNCTIAVDGEVMVREGDVVPKDQRA